MRNVGPARSVPTSGTSPLFATTFAVLGLGEILTLRRAVGILLLVVGILCNPTERARR
ncbi:MAG: EamA family transporter [Candidatus Methylomirabilales bacterium]